MPEGVGGRPSKSLTFAQAEAVLAAAVGAVLYAYIVLSLLIGARTEELRALTWADVDLIGNPDANPPVPPSMSVFRSVRESGDTTTRKSRRRLAMPQRCVDAIRMHLSRLSEPPASTDLVFVSRVGTALDSHNVRRSFRRVIKKAGLPPKDWTPRELRHSFVAPVGQRRAP